MSKKITLAIIAAATLCSIAVAGCSEPDPTDEPAGTASSAITSPVGLELVPISPCRIVDTRLSGGLMAGSETRTFTPTASPCGIPSDAKALAVNTTVVPSGPLGFVTMWPAGEAQPLASTLNAVRGEVVANSAIVPMGASGQISAFVSNPTHLIIDVQGYFRLPNGAGSLFYPVTPCRVVDTRLTNQTIAAVSSITVSIPASCGVAGNATAYSYNVTAVPKGPVGYVTTWPAGTTMPVASTLNAPSGAVTANGAIVAAGPLRATSIFADAATDIVIDINGYFAPPSASGLPYFPVSPCRAVDTRVGQGKSGPFGPPALYPLAERTLPLAASGCSIPANAKAVATNFTTVAPGPLGFLTTWAAGQTRPLASTLNSPRGGVVANAALVPTNGTGAINVFATETTELIVDVSGYFAPASSTGPCM
ncbi:MAG: hypothetical protein JST00_02290 [Deltaproteobacteria bacterium]|nr:hypothetical protein [Deltaproteobacteria bacterium]